MRTPLNELKKLVAAGGEAKSVDLFPSHSFISSTSTSSGPFISVYDESNNMNLLWSKAFEAANQKILQVRFTPDGTKLVFEISTWPSTIAVFDPSNGN